MPEPAELCPTTPHGRPLCAQLLVRYMSMLGAEVTVSTAPPIVHGRYTTDPFRCPHGVAYWIEPTGEQICAWVEGGVP
jgi:hypothetical protein